MDAYLKRRGLIRRKLRVRKRVVGTSIRPRLSVYRSNSHIYAQIIDDDSGKTLASASSRDPKLKKSEMNGGNIDAAQKVGTLLAERAKAASVENIVFDRSGRMYHGRVRALADAARTGGLVF